MFKTSIGVVIPCYKCGTRSLEVVKKSLIHANYVVLVDDAYPFKTGEIVKNEFNDKRLKVIYNEKNLGVGGSTKIGINWLIKKECKIIVKIDGDGQMDPNYIPNITKPIIEGMLNLLKGIDLNL